MTTDTFKGKLGQREKVLRQQIRKRVNCREPESETRKKNEEGRMLCEQNDDGENVAMVNKHFSGYPTPLPLILRCY